MSDIKASGKFILENFDTFNETVYFFTNTINPKIEHGIDKCTEVFAKKNEWDIDFQLSKNDSNWLRPKHWNTDFIEAWFSFGFTDDENNNDYWITLLFNKSKKNAVAGLFFDVDKKSFGGKRIWDNHLKNISNEHAKELENIGFKEFDGNFFIPITLSNSEVAKSWLTDNPYTHDDDCFAPLREALEAAKKSVEIFDAIMQSALKAQRA